VKSNPYTCEDVRALGREFDANEVMYLSVRPENIKLSTAPVEGFSVKGLISDFVYVGSIIKTVIKLPNNSTVLVTRFAGERSTKIGDVVNLYWNEDSAVAIKNEKRVIMDLLNSGSAMREEMV